METNRIAVASPQHRRSEAAFMVRADGRTVDVSQPHACCIHSQPQPAPMLRQRHHGFSTAEVAMLRQRGMTPEAARRRLDGDL